MENVDLLPIVLAFVPPIFFGVLGWVATHLFEPFKRKHLYSNFGTSGEILNRRGYLFFISIGVLLLGSAFGTYNILSNGWENQTFGKSKYPHFWLEKGSIYDEESIKLRYRYVFIVKYSIESPSLSTSFVKANLYKEPSNIIRENLIDAGYYARLKDIEIEIVFSDKTFQPIVSKKIDLRNLNCEEKFFYNANKKELGVCYIASDRDSVDNSIYDGKLHAVKDLTGKMLLVSFKVLNTPLRHLDPHLYDVFHIGINEYLQRVDITKCKNDTLNSIGQYSAIYKYRTQLLLSYGPQNEEKIANFLGGQFNTSLKEDASKDGLEENQLSDASSD